MRFKYANFIVIIYSYTTLYIAYEMKVIEYCKELYNVYNKQTKCFFVRPIEMYRMNAGTIASYRYYRNTIIYKISNYLGKIVVMINIYKYNRWNEQIT